MTTTKPKTTLAAKRPSTPKPKTAGKAMPTLSAKATHKDTQRHVAGAVKALEKAATVRLNVDVDAGLYKELKLLAVTSDRSISDLVRELLTEAVTKRSK